MRALRHLCIAVALAALLSGAALADALLGTWYVLVHYQDTDAEHPERERWEDRIWIFERDGGKLRWTEYPTVVFKDRTGRFERGMRTLQYWEPTPKQRDEIANGLPMKPLGSKHKPLFGSDEQGWSSSRALGGASASSLTYSEIWSIESADDLPVFSKSAALSGASVAGVQGLTRYATTERREATLSGTFDRDGVRHGKFRMMRSGGIEPPRDDVPQEAIP